MKTPRRFFSRHAVWSACALAFVIFSSAWADRFIVPVPSGDSSGSSAPSSPPPSPPSAPSGGGDSSYSGGGSSGSSSSYSPGDYRRSDSGRFIVPVPGGGRSNPGSGGGGSGGHYGHPYWGGYYYCAGSYYYWGGRYYWPHSELVDPFVTAEISRYDDYTTDAVFFYFPPVAPPLGAPLPPPPPTLTGHAAPAELARYVNEPFYAPLASRLAKRNLSAKLRERIDGYARQKDTELEKLRDFLDSLETLPAEKRAEEMEAFSAHQTPTLVQLEATAEQIRADLLHRSFKETFVGEADWNSARPWRLNDNLARYYSPDVALDYEFRVMRAAAFFQEGLSPDQRRLLREIAMELQVLALTPQNQGGARSEENLLFFQPATARIKVPQNLPEELADKIDLYRKEKAAIKAKLRQTVFDVDRQSPNVRANALRKLAEEQEPRIEELNTLAEEIRVGLVALPEIKETSPTFSPELASRISAYAKAKQAYQTDWRQRVAETSPSSLRQRWQDLNREFAPRREELQRQKERIRAEIATWAASRPASEPRKSIDDLLKEFGNAQNRQESWHMYDDYRRAVLLPGLSPEQRRLLFDGALEKLALPLPSGETFPWH